MEPVLTKQTETSIDQSTTNDRPSTISSLAIKSIGEPPRLISSPSNQSSTKPPGLISSDCNVVKLVSSEPQIEELDKRLPNVLPVYDSIALNEEVVSVNLTGSTTEIGTERNVESNAEGHTKGIVERDTEGNTQSNPEGNRESKPNLTVKERPAEMAGLDGQGSQKSLNSQTMSANDNKDLLDSNEKPIGAQWSRELGNADSLFFFDKYFLRGADDHAESLLQDCVPSTFGDHHSDSRLINEHPVDSMFKFDDDPADHKPSTTELNYYSSQYQTNLNCFDQSPQQPQYQPPTQANLYSHFLHSFSPFDYTHIHQHNGDGQLVGSPQQLNSSSTTVTYSNGSLQPISHHYAFKSSSEETDCGSQPSTQHFYPTSHPSSLHSSNFSSSFNDLSSCDNSFNFTPNFHLTNTPIYRSGLAPHPMSALFDTDAGCIQERVQEEPKDADLSADQLKAKLVKQEHLDEFNIRNSLDLVNSNHDHYMDAFPTNEHVVMSSHHPRLETPHASAVQHSSAGGFYSSDFRAEPKLAKTAHPMTASIQLSASSIVNGNKKLISLKEAANVKLEKVKIERANGMKIYYFKCSLCTYQTNTSQSMKDHLYCIHCKAKNNYKCNICQQTFGWKNNAQRHMRRKHKIEDQTTKREAIITLV